MKSKMTWNFTMHYNFGENSTPYLYVYEHRNLQFFKNGIMLYVLLYNLLFH